MEDKNKQILKNLKIIYYQLANSFEQEGPEPIDEEEQKRLEESLQKARKEMRIVELEDKYKIAIEFGDFYEAAELAEKLRKLASPPDQGGKHE